MIPIVRFVFLLCLQGSGIQGIAESAWNRMQIATAKRGNVIRLQARSNPRTRSR